jgi:alpha-L-fucosidase
MGPKKDIVGLFRKAAQKHGLKFGVSEHLAVSYHWFQTSHGADKEGPQKGVAYDGRDPKFIDLYHETHDAPKSAWDPAGVPLKWKQHYFARMKDLLDKYEPDLLYTDGPIFFEEWGLGMTAHLYNSSAKRNGGKVEAVYANKGKTDCNNGICLLDVERGVVEKTWPEPWQTDTCIGHWHYDKEVTYKSPKMVVDLLVDIVSRNGNLLLNFPLPSSGALDEKELQILGEITKWMSVNGELIYGSRPWKTFGSGPATDVDTAARPGMGAHHVAGAFNENKRKALGAGDVRFVQKGNTLVAFVMGWPQDQPVVIRELKAEDGAVQNVELHGHAGKLEWSQNAQGLTVKMPSQRPCDHAVALKIKG